MLRATLNKMFSSRVFYILVSLVASIALWMYVELNINEEKRFPVSNIPIVFRNADRLQDRGLLISSFEPETVSLTFHVPRAVAAKLQRTAVSVEVDLSGIMSPGPTYQPYVIIYPPGVNGETIDVTRLVSNIFLSVDRLHTRPVDVRVEFSGETASEDLIPDTVEFSPQSITVKGPEEVVSRISSARVPVNIEPLSSTYTGDLEFVLLDENGEEFDEELLSSVTVSHETVHVTIPIRQMKSIPLTVDFAYGAGSSESNTEWQIEPPFITISGDPDVIKDVNSVNLGVVSTITRRDMTFTVLPPRPIVLQDYVKNLSGETEALITVTIHGLNLAYFSTTNLQYINVPADLRPDWVTQTLDVTIRGKPEDLALVSLDNIRVVADLRDRPAGPHRIPATVFIDAVAADVGPVGEYFVTVRLIKDTE